MTSNEDMAAEAQEALVSTNVIHDADRAESIRQRANIQLQRIAHLQARTTTAELPELMLAREQLKGIEDFYLAQLFREERTPAQEAIWLNSADRMLAIWTEHLDRLEEKFKAHGTGPA